MILIAPASQCGEAPAPVGRTLSPAPAQLPAAQLVGTLPTTIAGSSGVIKSRRYPDKDLFWTHNDYGERLFAISGKGKLIREIAIPHVADVNWEELAMDEQGRIVICDIGDNFRKRASFALYRLAEPDALDPAGAVAETQTFRFRYPKGQGPFDAEALLARAGQAWLFTKELDRTRCYLMPLPENPPPADTEPVEAELLGETKTMSTVTASSLTDDGRHLALLSYLCVVVIDLPEPFEKMARTPEGLGVVFSRPRRVRLGFLGQAEGVCWDGNDLLLTSENGDNMHLGKECGEVFRVAGVLPSPAK